VELGNMQIGGQVRMLDAQGIDPFLFLIIPRVVAVSVCMFSLTIAFIAVALGSGFLAGNALGSMDFTLYDFVFGILAKMGLADFATIPLKTVSIGFVVALIACTTGLSVSGSRSDLLAALPRGITKSVLATLLISSVLTLLL
jgi:phospholipid/cholesterol/gamma-HCH transport system permease protein